VHFLDAGYIFLTNNKLCAWYFDFNLVTSALMEYDTFETNTITCLITNVIFHAYRVNWFLDQFWVIMSTGMGCISKYRIQTFSNSTEIGTASPKITLQNLNFALYNLRSSLSALRSTLTYSNPPPLSCLHMPKKSLFVLQGRAYGIPLCAPVLCLVEA